NDRTLGVSQDRSNRDAAGSQATPGLNNGLLQKHLFQCLHMCHFATDWPEQHYTPGWGSVTGSRSHLPPASTSCRNAATYSVSARGRATIDVASAWLLTSRCPATRMISRDLLEPL